MVRPSQRSPPEVGRCETAHAPGSPPHSTDLGASLPPGPRSSAQEDGAADAAGPPRRGAEAVPWLGTGPGGSPPQALRSPASGPAPTGVTPTAAPHPWLPVATSALRSAPATPGQARCSCGPVGTDAAGREKNNNNSHAARGWK